MPQPIGGTDLADITASTAAALVTWADGREYLAFYLDCAAWSPACPPLGRMAVAWVMRGGSAAAAAP
jgi:hypothetical protein